MYAMERQELIERMLLDQRRVGVLELADRFGITTETVRRDLDALERVGALRRVHGGAVVNDRPSTAEATVSERASRRSGAKHAIAARALDILGEGFDGSVYLDAGTTTGAIAELLPARLAATHGRAEVVTHSLTLAPALAAADGVSLSLVGGRIRGITAAAVGSATVRTVEGLRPDVAFVGSNGLSAGFGLSTPDPEEAAVKDAIVRTSRRVVATVDASKFGREYLIGFGALERIDVLVTDAAPTAELTSALAEADVEVWLA